MRQNLQIPDIINYQKEQLSKWRYEFECSLLKHSNKSLSVYIISKEWLENYEEYIFNFQKESELVNFFNTYPYIDTTNLFKSLNIKEFPKISVVNESCIKALIRDSNVEKPINLSGRFYNKKFIIEIEMLSHRNNKVFSIFFVDKNSLLRQGYLSIHKLNKEKEILKNLDISSIIKNYNNKNGANNDGINLYSNEYDLHIFESEKRKYYYNKYDDKNTLNFIAYNFNNNEIFLENSRKKKRKH